MKGKGWIQIWHIQAEEDHMEEDLMEDHMAVVNPVDQGPIFRDPIIIVISIGEEEESLIIADMQR